MTIKSINTKLATLARGFIAATAILAFTAPVFATPVFAAATTCTTDCLQAGANAAQASGTATELGNVFQTVSNTLIYIVGAVAVIFLIIGGLRYVISNGDPKAVTAAKDTILYAIIGIVVAILSFAAVNFVISRFITT